MTMSEPRYFLLVWIGAWSGIVGILIYYLGQSDEMLPVIRVLLAINAILMMVWFLDFLLGLRKERR